MPRALTLLEGARTFDGGAPGSRELLGPGLPRGQGVASPQPLPGAGGEFRSLPRPRCPSREAGGWLVSQARSHPGSGLEAAARARPGAGRRCWGQGVFGWRKPALRR